MTPPAVCAPPSVTDGGWLDLASAAMYAGVTLHALEAALDAGELSVWLPATRVTPPLVHSHDVEHWAAERESAASARVADDVARHAVALAS